MPGGGREQSSSGNQLVLSRPAESDELGWRCEHQHLPPALRVPWGPLWAGAGRQQRGGGSQLGTPSSLSWSQASTGGWIPAGLGVTLPRHESPPALGAPGGLPMAPELWGWSLPSLIGGVRMKRRGTSIPRERAEARSRWDGAIRAVL